MKSFFSTLLVAESFDESILNQLINKCVNQKVIFCVFFLLKTFIKKNKNVLIPSITILLTTSLMHRLFSSF